MGETNTDIEAALVCLGDGGSRVHRFSVAAGRYIVGREGDVRIDDPSMSRHHAWIISLPGGRFELIDCGSLNGTYVNGVRIARPTTIRSGDEIRFGKTTCVFQERAGQELGGDEPAGDVEGADAASRPESLRAGLPLESLQVEESVEALVLAADLRGSTRLAKAMGQQRFSQFLARWHEGIDAALHSQRYTVETAGDGLLAVTHSPGASEADVFAAMRALLAVRDLTSRLAEEYGIETQIGAGMCRGPVSFTNIRTSSGGRQRVSGVPLSLAVRLEAETKKHRGVDLLVSAEVLQRLPMRLRNTCFQECALELNSFPEQKQGHGCAFEALGAFFGAMESQG